GHVDVTEDDDHVGRLFGQQPRVGRYDLAQARAETSALQRQVADDRLVDAEVLDDFVAQARRGVLADEHDPRLAPVLRLQHPRQRRQFDDVRSRADDQVYPAGLHGSIFPAHRYALPASWRRPSLTTVAQRIPSTRCRRAGDPIDTWMSPGRSGP